MKKLISERFALYGLIIILSLFVLFHLLVMTGIIPYQIVWGGKFNKPSKMLGYETLSVFIILLMLVIGLVKAQLLKVHIPPIILKIAFWIMFGFFLLNTAGNLMSDNNFERLAFTPVTLILAVFCLRLALSTANIQINKGERAKPGRAH